MNLVVTVPKWFWPEWIAEGDAAGEPYSGEEWGFFLGGNKPPIGPGDRLYIVAHNRLRGFAPVTDLRNQNGKWVICRRGGGAAVTIEETIKGFQGFRKVWWLEAEEKAFPGWKTEGTGINAETQRAQRPAEKPVEQKGTEGTETEVYAKGTNSHELEMQKLVLQITEAVAKYRLTFGSEAELQGQLATIFAAAGIAFEREVRISAKDRLDFLIPKHPTTNIEHSTSRLGKETGSVLRTAENGADGHVCPTGLGFAIEVKVGGSVDSHLRQMKRYNEHPSVMGTILISTRRYDLPGSLAGKPVAGVSVGQNRL